jgi:hypothetical protein
MNWLDMRTVVFGHVLTEAMGTLVVFFLCARTREDIGEFPGGRPVLAFKRRGCFSLWSADSSRIGSRYLSAISF